MNRRTQLIALSALLALAAFGPSSTAQAQIYEGTFIGTVITPANGQTIASVYSYPGGGVRIYSTTGSSTVMVVTGSSASGDTMTLSFISYMYFAQPEDTSFWTKQYGGQVVLTASTAAGGASGYFLTDTQYIADVPHTIPNPRPFYIEFVPAG